MQLVWGAALAVFLYFSMAIEGFAQASCADAPAAVKDCQQQVVPLFAVNVAGQVRIYSAPLRLSAGRLYWSCCAAGPDGAAIADASKSLFLVKQRDVPADEPGLLEECAAAIAEGAEWTSLVPGDGFFTAQVIGWADPVLADAAQLCIGAPVVLDGGAPAGNATIVSVPVDTIPEDVGGGSNAP